MEDGVYIRISQVRILDLLGWRFIGNWIRKTKQHDKNMDRARVVVVEDGKDRLCLA